jgi:hypothetical protein
MENTMKTPYLLLGLLACALSLPALAADKVYKWKDANGIVHFTDQPPPKGTEFDNVQVKGSVTTELSGAEKGNPADPGKAADEAAAAAAAAATPNKQQCDEAKTQVSQLSGPGDVATTDKDGKTVRLNKESRANELAIAKAKVQTYCGKDGN